VLYIPSKSRDLADENNKILTEWKWFETTVLVITNIYRIIKFSWYRVTRMSCEMWFDQISYARHVSKRGQACERCDFNQIGLPLYYDLYM